MLLPIQTSNENNLIQHVSSIRQIKNKLFTDENSGATNLTTSNSAFQIYSGSSKLPIQFLQQAQTSRNYYSKFFRVLNISITVRLNERLKLLIVFLFKTKVK